MTAEEKAKELVNKYYCAKDSIGLSYCINYSNAKAAALIAVDEILDFVHPNCVDYVLTVREEIEKL